MTTDTMHDLCTQLDWYRTKHEAYEQAVRDYFGAEIERDIEAHAHKIMMREMGYSGLVDDLAYCDRLDRMDR